MISIFNKKENNISKLSLKRPIKLRQLNKLEYIDKINSTNTNERDITLNITRKEDNSYNYRISTLQTETNENSNIKYETVFAHHISKIKNNTKNKNLIGLFKKNIFPTKKILRPKTTSKLKYKPKNNIHKECNINNIFKYYSGSTKHNFEGVPVSFIESMRLNLNQNIVKAKSFLKQEKKRLLKEHPNLKYQIHYNKNQKMKKDELEKVNQYKMLKKYLQENKKEFNIYELNNHYSKLLLRENKQYFDYIKPILDKTKFDSKFRLLTDNNNLEEIQVQQNYKDLRDIKKIFNKYLKAIKKDKLTINKTRKIAKEKVYQKFKSIIQKCAIEFKNIIIPYNELINFYKSKKIIEYLFDEEYCKLIRMIKREGSINNEQKENDIIKIITNNKLLIYTVDFYGQNILFLAVKYKLYKTISKIIQFGANVNLKDFKGRTPLHFAVKNNDITAITILLYYLADPTLKDCNEKTSFDYIIKNNSYDNYLIKELLIRCKIIRKLNKYHSWKEFDIYIRRGIQYYLKHNISKERYYLIFSFIDNCILYYS